MTSWSRIALAAVALLALTRPAQATPYFTQEPRTLPEGKWRIGEHLLFSHCDESLVDGEETPLLAGAEGSSFIANTRVRYGLRDRITLLLEVPYVERRLVARNGSEIVNRGFGDLFFVAKYKFHDNRETKTRGAVAVGTKLSTGESRGLPPELALGTGQTNTQFALLAEKEAGANAWYASMIYGATGERSDTHTDPGEIFALNGAVEHTLGKGPYNLVGEINYFHQGRSAVNGVTVAASGSSTLNVAVGAQYSPPMKQGRKRGIETELQIPVRTSGFMRALPDYVYYLGAYMVF